MRKSRAKAFLFELRELATESCQRVIALVESIMMLIEKLLTWNTTSNPCIFFKFNGKVKVSISGSQEHLSSFNCKKCDSMQRRVAAQLTPSSIASGADFADVPGCNTAMVNPARLKWILREHLITRKPSVISMVATLIVPLFGWFMLRKVNSMHDENMYTTL